MTISRLGRYALTSCAAAALLAGCGVRSGVPTAGPVAATAARAHDALRDSSPPLLYVSAPSTIFVFAFPSGDFVQSFLAGINGVEGLCSDQNGDVFVVGSNHINEYAYGETSPFATITEPASLRAIACSVDPTTGNLAVLNNSGYNATVAVYPGAQGTPTYYDVPKMLDSFSTTYDNNGNLFVDGTESTRLAELPQGSSSFTAISISKKRLPNFGTLQWDSGVLLMASKTRVYQLQISGSTASIVGITTVKGGKPYSWVYDGTLIEPYGHDKEIAFWKYPKGGKPTKVIGQVSRYFEKLDGVVVVVPPSR